MDKQYAPRDMEYLDSIGGYYSKHVTAMTTEGLTSKSDIAAELAHRDAEIDSMQKVIDNLEIVCCGFDYLICAVMACDNNRCTDMTIEAELKALITKMDKIGSEKTLTPMTRDTWMSLLERHRRFKVTRDAQGALETNRKH